ncbi:MAG: ribbon-helix-helix protein, CopG family [Solirubrobacterales bacterium]
MVRIEINLPDDLLRQIDVAAERAGLARDELIRRCTEEDVVRRGAEYRKEIEDMLGPPVPMGGNAAEVIREMRDTHPPIRRGNVDEE